MGAKLSAQEEAAEQARAQLAVISTRLSRQDRASTTRRLQVQFLSLQNSKHRGTEVAFAVGPRSQTPGSAVNATNP